VEAGYQQVYAPNGRPHLRGHLRLTCEASPALAGRSVLRRREFRPPIHISKPYWDGQCLLLNIMCPTAGLLGNDQVEIEVEVRSGAALLLSNPSSLRIHKMRADEDANWRQRYTVESGALLENNPEWLILQAESSFIQRTEIQLAADSELFFVEALAPGRIAHGEAHRFRRFRNRLALRQDGELALLEKHDLDPLGPRAQNWRDCLATAHPYYLSILLASPKLGEDSPIWKFLCEMGSDQLRIGSSRLAAGSCWSVKILSAEPVAARCALERLRCAFYEEIGRTPSSLRR